MFIENPQSHDNVTDSPVEMHVALHYIRKLLVWHKGLLSVLTRCLSLNWFKRNILRAVFMVSSIVPTPATVQPKLVLRFLQQHLQAKSLKLYVHQRVGHRYAPSSIWFLLKICREGRSSLLLCQQEIWVGTPNARSVFRGEGNLEAICLSTNNHGFS